MFQFLLVSCFLLLLGFVLPSSLLAQSITLLSPNQPLSLKEGDDFASVELGDPWDFSERRDFGYEVDFRGESISVEQGIWRGENASAGAYVFPLFGGFQGALHAEGLEGDKTLPRLGTNHPIDAARYPVFSMRMRHSAASSYALYWRKQGEEDLWPDGSQMGSSYDGFYADRGYSSDGYSVYLFDMRELPFEISLGHWDGSIVALRIDPSVASPAGAHVEFDWVRLSDPNSSPMLEIKWLESNMPKNSIITVWLDTTPGGYRGTPLVRYRSSGTAAGGAKIVSTNPTLAISRQAHLLPTAALPPGEYYFYITGEEAIDGRLTQRARSNYSSRLAINAAPKLFFSSPSQVSGSDYAERELHDAWDMSNSGDIANLAQSGLPQELRQFSNASISDGIFQALADPPLKQVGNLESDAQVRLRVPTTMPIDVRRYRYLSYRLGADATLYPSIEEKVRQGWVSRPVFWDKGIFLDGGSAKAHVLYEGMHTYTIDLWDPSIIETGLSWLGNRSLSTLRIDPLETSIPTWFFIDWVKLNTEHYAENGKCRISWNIEDLDSTRFSVSLYYDNDSQGFDGTLIKALDGLRIGEQVYSWDCRELSSGSYYVYAELSDGQNTFRRYAPVPCVVGGSSFTTVPAAAAYDFDGDRVSDHVVFRPDLLGSFFSRGSSSPVSQLLSGGSTSQPIHGDFDGDRKQDRALVFENGGVLEWFVILSNDGGLLHRRWGVRGDIVAVADYNGDFRDDMAVYRNGLWYILYTDGSVELLAWGLPGDVPVPADYDGDGRADPAVWRPADGVWWVRYMNPRDGSDSFASVQWGLPGDRTTPGDYDNDGKTDYAVWRGGNGTWYVKFSSKREPGVWQWGLPGDIPIVGDFSGDGFLDLSVWRPSDGSWFHNNRLGVLEVVQWGLPGDRIPESRQTIN